MSFFADRLGPRAEDASPAHDKLIGQSALSLPPCIRQATTLAEAASLLRDHSINGALVPGQIWNSPAIPAPIRNFWRTCIARDIVINTTLPELRLQLTKTLDQLGFPNPAEIGDPNLADSVVQGKELWIDELVRMAEWSSAFANSPYTSFFITSTYPTPFWHIDCDFAVAFQCFDGLGPDFSTPEGVATWDRDELVGDRLVLRLLEEAPFFSLEPGMILLTRDLPDRDHAQISTLNKPILIHF
ncbi:MAG: hypothetical protein K1X79_05665 [Oligoflexia bacterium]|nr:hypothetical protein [Oligoflexia bacterium]